MLCCEIDCNSTTLIVKGISGNYLDRISNLSKWKINVHLPLAGLSFSVLIRTFEVVLKLQVFFWDLRFHGSMYFTLWWKAYVTTFKTTIVWVNVFLK